MDCGRLAQVRIFQNLIEDLPARAARKNFSKFACPRAPKGARSTQVALAEHTRTTLCSPRSQSSTIKYDSFMTCMWRAVSRGYTSRTSIFGMKTLRFELLVSELLARSSSERKPSTLLDHIWALFIPVILI